MVARPDGSVPWSESPLMLRKVKASRLPIVEGKLAPVMLPEIEMETMRGMELQVTPVQGFPEPHGEWAYVAVALGTHQLTNVAFIVDDFMVSYIAHRTFPSVFSVNAKHDGIP